MDGAVVPRARISTDEAALRRIETVFWRIKTSFTGLYDLTLSGEIYNDLSIHLGLASTADGLDLGQNARQSELRNFQTPPHVETPTMKTRNRIKTAVILATQRQKANSYIREITVHFVDPTASTILRWSKQTLGIPNIRKEC